jgi:threonine aldolase
MIKARRAAKMPGGSMRQARLIAAPALVALQDPYPATSATMNWRVPSDRKRADRRSPSK